MDKKSLALNSSVLTNENNNLASKLRRLRIQEALLLQSIQKPVKNYNEDVDTTLSYKNILKKIKDSYIHLKNSYDEVKANTQSQELLADLDIDEIKKKIFELETNIKTFKSDINSELAVLKLTEQDLDKQILENPNEVENIKRRPKTHSVSFNAIVPSPVRALVTSPFKCVEVQQFQEFMKNSPNRYGGWNEYNHNLFVKYWQKFFGKIYSSEFENGLIQQSITYEIFKEDVITKLQGLLPSVTESSIASHVKWYVQYLFHKEKQQNAIDKWKWNKSTARKIPKKVMYADEEDSFSIETTKDAHNFIACNFNTSRYGPPERETNKITITKSLITKGKLNKKQPDRTHSIMKPTKQWLNRYHPDDGDIGTSSVHCIESMGKQLRTPYWRLGV